MFLKATWKEDDDCDQQQQQNQSQFHAYTTPLDIKYDTREIDNELHQSSAPPLSSPPCYVECSIKTPI